MLLNKFSLGGDKDRKMMEKLTSGKISKSYFEFMDKYSGKKISDVMNGKIYSMKYKDEYSPYGKDYWYFNLNYIPTYKELTEMNNMLMDPEWWGLDKEDRTEFRQLIVYLTIYSVIYFDDVDDLHVMLFNKINGTIGSFWPGNQWVNEPISIIGRNWDDMMRNFKLVNY